MAGSGLLNRRRHRMSAIGERAGDVAMLLLLVCFVPVAILLIGGPIALVLRLLMELVKKMI